LACYKTISKSNPSVLKAWERAGQAKIALKVDSEDEMLLLEAQAASLGLVARVIQDASVIQMLRGRSDPEQRSHTDRSRLSYRSWHRARTRVGH
jgi:peptidyl-tRNA hydrolase